MFVYKITNTVNDRVYVGLTAGPLKTRWRQHLCDARKGTDKPLYRAMLKHGSENFSIHLIYTATSIEDMRAAEIRYIAELKAHVADGGYNLTDHGFKHGCVDQLKGEKLYNAELSEAMVAFIRDPAHWDKTNAQMLELIKERFDFSGARDTVRDARRGDAWKHLNDKYPPVKTGQGKRGTVTEKRKVISTATLAANHAEAVRKSAELRKGKRGNHAKLSEQTVRDIFYNPESLLKTAAKYNVSKKMVLLIKQRRAHVYLTKDL